MARRQFQALWPRHFQYEVVSALPGLPPMAFETSMLNHWQMLVKLVLRLAVPGLISADIFAFTLSWN